MSNTAKVLETDGFKLDWSYEADYVTFNLSAPTNGWVALGFTEGTSIVGSNLIQGTVKNNRVIIEDQFVIGFGEHPPVDKLGASTVIFDLNGIEKNGTTTITFSIPIRKSDKYHFDLAEGRTINVLLAWSVLDDFDHHSRKRILRTISL